MSAASNASRIWERCCRICGLKVSNAESAGEVGVGGRGTLEDSDERREGVVAKARGGKEGCGAAGSKSKEDTRNWSGANSYGELAEKGMPRPWCCGAYAAAARVAMWFGGARIGVWLLYVWETLYAWWVWYSGRMMDAGRGYGGWGMREVDWANWGA